VATAFSGCCVGDLLGEVGKSVSSAGFTIQRDGENAKVGRDLLGINRGERTASAYVRMEELVREVEKPELTDSDALRGEECLLRLSGDSAEEKEEL